MTQTLRASTVLSLSLLLGACSAAGNHGQATNSSLEADGLLQMKAATTDGDPSADPLSCLDNKVDFVLNTEVVGFEMQGGGGLNAGFSPTGIALTNLKIGVNYSQGRLQTMMHVEDPLKPGVPIADIGGSATARNITFSLDFAAALLSMGPSFYYSTPISTLSANALGNNLTALGKNLAALDESEWWTTITQLDGQQGFFVPIGSHAGLAVGDQFKVMDARYVWANKGQPCVDELIMPLFKTNVPKAFARATKVGVDYAYFEVMSANGPLSVHDYVTVSALVQTDAILNDKPLRQLGRSIRIGTIKSKPLTFTGQGGLASLVDIAPYVQDQLQTMLPQRDFGDFYVHQ